MPIKNQSHLTKFTFSLNVFKSGVFTFYIECCDDTDIFVNNGIVAKVKKGKNHIVNYTLPSTKKMLLLKLKSSETTEFNVIKRFGDDFRYINKSIEVGGKSITIYCDKQFKSSICIVCQDKDPEITLCTCGHKCICFSCMKQLIDKKCPICRNKFHKYIKWN